MERLSFATIVMSSEAGSEQRQGSRLTPRREFEATFNPVDNVRTYFDLWLSTLGGQEMMVPLWHDKHKITAAIEAGDDRIDCDTEFGEFAAGGMALLIGPDPWSHQAVRIDAVDGIGLDLAADCDTDWPVGAVILPLRRARLDLQPTLTGLTNRVGESQMRFILNQANPLPDIGEWGGMVYAGLPVVTIESDWGQGIDLAFNRITEEEDNGTGLAYIRDIAERAFRTKTHTWHLHGRELNYIFRQFLYQLDGRRSPVWMPTGNQDFIVAETADVGAASVVVEKVGLGYLGGPQPGRDRVLARTGEGLQARRITGMGAAPSLVTERLNLDAILTYEIPAGTKLQFLEIARADGDDIELLHHTDVEGATECSINFRSFDDSRDPSGSIYVPYGEGEMSDVPCGTADNPCYPFITPTDYWEIEISWTPTIPGPYEYPDVGSMLLPEAIGPFPNGGGLPAGWSIVPTVGGYDHGGGLWAIHDTIAGVPGTGGYMVTIEYVALPYTLRVRIYGARPTSGTFCFQTQFFIGAYPGGGPSDGGGWPAWVRMRVGDVTFLDQEFTVLRLWPTYQCFEYEYNP